MKRPLRLSPDHSSLPGQGPAMATHLSDLEPLALVPGCGTSMQIPHDPHKAQDCQHCAGAVACRDCHGRFCPGVGHPLGAGKTSRGPQDSLGEQAARMHFGRGV